MKFKFLTTKNGESKMEMDEITINGKTYVEKGSLGAVHAKARPDGLEYCIIRTYSAGVFAGWYDRDNKSQAGTVHDARGIYYWEGAMTLSQLATDGTNKPENCKFTVKADHDLKQIIDVIPCTEKAMNSIEGVAIWKK